MTANCTNPTREICLQIYIRLFNTKRNKITCIKRTFSLLVAQTNTAGEIIGFVVLVLAPQINGHGATSHFYRERYPDGHVEATVEAARFGQVECLALSLVAGLGGRAAVEIVQGASCTEVRDPKFPDLVAHKGKHEVSSASYMCNKNTDNIYNENEGTCECRIKGAIAAVISTTNTY